MQIVHSHITSLTQIHSNFSGTVRVKQLLALGRVEHESGQESWAGMNLYGLNMVFGELHNNQGRRNREAARAAFPLAFYQERQGGKDALSFKRITFNNLSRNATNEL